MPGIYRKGYTYVRDMSDDAEGIVYMFRTKAEADEFAATNENYAVFGDREYKPANDMVEAAQNYGGFYTKARRSTPPMLLKDGQTFMPERLDVTETYARYISSISNEYSTAEYKLKAVEQWKKEVQEIAKLTGRPSGLQDPRDWNSELLLEANHKQYFENAREWMKNMFNLQSKDEALTEQAMLNFARWMEGKTGGDPISNAAFNFAGKSLTGVGKGVAFNLMLGMFNARQFFVQMQNAATSMMAHPQYALQAATEAMYMRFLIALPDKTLAAGGKFLGLSDDVIESVLADVRAFKASKLYDGIYVDPDTKAAASGIHSPSNSRIVAAAKAGGRVIHKGSLLPFQEGELMARLVSFGVAKRMWKAANKGKKVSLRDVEEISNNAMRMAMNMQRSNAAWWQNAPVLGLMTQFMQVQAKFLENLLPRALGGNKQWTRAEKIRIGLGQLALYGTSGTLLVQEWATYAASATGQDPVEFIAENPQLVKVVNEGFTGMMLSSLGMDKINVTESTSLWAGMDDTLIADFITGLSRMADGLPEDSGIVQTMFGPVGSTFIRFGNVFDVLIDTSKAVIREPSGETLYEAIKMNADMIARLTSSYTNARKAIILESLGRLENNMGVLVLTSDEIGELTLQEKVARAMGFQFDVEQRMYRMREGNRADARDRREIRKMYELGINYELTSQTEEGREFGRIMKGIAMEAAPVYDRATIKQEAIKDIFNGKSQYSTEVVTAFKNVVHRQSSENQARIEQMIEENK